MVAIALVPLVMAIIGALVYALASNAKAVEIGRALMWAGLFAFAFQLSAHVVRIG